MTGKRLKTTTKTALIPMAGVDTAGDALSMPSGSTSSKSGAMTNDGRA